MFALMRMGWGDRPADHAVNLGRRVVPRDSHLRAVERDDGVARNLSRPAITRKVSLDAAVEHAWKRIPERAVVAARHTCT
jgi:hypothetical protein